MTRLLPRDLKKALDRLEANPGRIWNVDELAVACGMARRTLYKHFSRFLNRTPMEFLRELRLDRARQELLRARPGTSVTDVATRYGFTHLGRFATFSRARHGESPSATLPTPMCLRATRRVTANSVGCRAPHDSGVSVQSDRL